MKFIKKTNAFSKEKRIFVKIRLPKEMSETKKRLEIAAISGDIETHFDTVSNLIGIKLFNTRFIVMWGNTLEQIKDSNIGEVIKYKKKKFIFFYTNGKDKVYLYPLAAVEFDPDIYSKPGKELIYSVKSLKAISLFGPFTEATPVARGKYAARRTAWFGFRKLFAKGLSSGVGNSVSHMRRR